MLALTKTSTLFSTDHWYQQEHTFTDMLNHCPYLLTLFFYLVQGTVIRSQFYSENGAEPEGEISITEYSTDPNDLKAGAPVTREKGITSVTTTQKFGYKGTPALKTLTGKDKQQSSENVQKKSSTTVGKVTRRGSVKEISQKFIENAGSYVEKVFCFLTFQLFVFH